MGYHKKIRKLDCKRLIPAPNIMPGKHYGPILHLEMERGFEKLQTC